MASVIVQTFGLAERSKDPLRVQTRTNPAMTSVSGYPFCYPCLFNFVTREQCCPVTRIPASIDSIRRLYQST